MNYREMYQKVKGTARRMLPFYLFALLPVSAFAQGDDIIRVNQVAFFPQQEKIAVVDNGGKKVTLSVRDVQTGKVVGKSRFVRISESPWSKKKRVIVDFSHIATPGRYELVYKDEVMPIEIKANALTGLTQGAI